MKRYRWFCMFFADFDPLCKVCPDNPLIDEAKLIGKEVEKK